MGKYIKKTVKKELSEAEFAELQIRYPNESNATLGISFNKSPSAIKWIADKHGWKKSQEWHEKQRGSAGRSTHIRRKQERDLSIERKTSGMKSREIATGTIYTKGNVTIHIGN